MWIAIDRRMSLPRDKRSIVAATSAHAVQRKELFVPATHSLLIVGFTNCVLHANFRSPLFGVPTRDSACQTIPFVSRLFPNRTAAWVIYVYFQSIYQGRLICGEPFFFCAVTTRVKCVKARCWQVGLNDHSILQGTHLEFWSESYCWNFLFCSILQVVHTNTRAGCVCAKAHRLKAYACWVRHWQHGLDTLHHSIFPVIFRNQLIDFTCLKISHACANWYPLASGHVIQLRQTHICTYVHIYI